ncbi:Holliday junction resolvase RuvX [Arcanobacterium hippocoleae]|uniref:Putative pre-16S rRNA nuclease n=1 Tax=Arcanobacterium hippocoleae TaxID=149017 RepID=A0ABU1T057_9ACTO|nr:Holliday junction resolvase RuvX [Arcanobacterium hippocoleae]MDR6938748.1 putative Holliday junction resolvase [Arcanobacterium hippocoleae]
MISQNQGGDDSDQQNNQDASLAVNPENRGNRKIRAGVRISVDVGLARVGVARSDTDGIMALPVNTFTREVDDFAGVLNLLELFHVLEIYVGLPLNMDGSEGKAAKGARRWANRLKRMITNKYYGFGPEIRMIDERLTTVTAHQQLTQAGKKMVAHRAVVDQQAAIIILEGALERERNSGQIPGIALE